ncbi:hypothetical protein VB713_11440 [Anabaena cylindrica UHCC 0172]|uniref:hypothetical protein n=1 Tax=Anabaena cylindrica TaxID=1165 RepID=UPI002B1F8E03|nr:hypothetical protein [Anabaena cylindrica]MEA5551585.1 hypothetical protein [Anabaena cylindrica UHCC 0172]
MTKPKANKLTWPVWFPYPSSWLKSFIIAFFLRIIIRIISFSGNIGYKLAYFANSPELFMIVTILVIILPIFIITFAHHILHIYIKKFFPKIQSPEMQNVQGFTPGIVSIWEGLYGWLVICLSSSIAFLITILIILPIFNISFYETTRFNSDYEEIILSIFGFIWTTTGAVIYQIDFLFKRYLLSISLRDSAQTNTLQSHTLQSQNIIDNKNSQVNDMDLEMNRLRGNVGLTHIKSTKKSPTNFPDSIISEPKNNFQQAMNTAKNAAQLTRAAKTKAEWYQVGIEWEKTIEMLKTVTNTDPNYEAAQYKIADYQKYINYAKKAVNSQNIN